MPRDVHADTLTAAQADRGHAYVYLAELYFDSTVASSRISWATLPHTAPPNSTFVFVSLTAGRAWYDVAENGGGIPGITVGQALHGRTLMVRTAFDPSVAAVEFDWIEFEITFDTGETILQRWDSQSEWNMGSLVGVEATPAGTLRAKNYPALEFDGSGGYVRVPGGYIDGSNNFVDSEIDLSTGVLRQIELAGTPGHGVYWAAFRTTVDGHDAKSVAKRAFSLQVSFQCDDLSPPQTLLQWGTASNYVGEGARLWIEAGTIRFAPENFTFSASHELLPTGTVVASPVLDRPPGAVITASLVFDGYVAALWVDGQHIARTHLREGRRDFSGAVGGCALMTGDLFIGRSPHGQRPFAGRMLEALLWKRVLTQGDIARRLGRKLTPAQAAEFRASGELIAAYQFDQGAGDTVIDIAGDNDGAIVQPGSAESGVRWAMIQSAEGERIEVDTAVSARDDVVLISRELKRLPTRDSPSIELAVYGNAVYVATTPFNFEYGDKTYIGVGHLGGIGEIGETSQIESRGLELSLSGIQLQHVSLAQQSIYRDRPCRVLMALLGDDGLIKGEPVILFEGVMDTMPMKVGEDATVSVTCESHLVRWEEARARRWTDASQRDLYPGDTGFDLLAVTAEKQIWWPAKFVNEPRGAIVIGLLTFAGIWAFASLFLGAG